MGKGTGRTEQGESRNRGNVKGGAKRPRLSLFLCVRFVKNPNSLERNFLFDFIVEQVIAGKQFFHDFNARPKADFEELHWNVPDDGGFETAPRDEETVIGSDVRHRSDKLI